MILHLYFARKFLWMIAAIGGLLFFLIVLIELIDLLRTFAEADVSFSQVVQLAFLKSPTAVYDILPLIILMATIALFVGLAQTSEMVVTRATGRSALRALIAPVAVAALLAGISVSTLGPLISTMENRFTRLSEQYRTGGSAALSVSEEGLWLRQGSEDGQTVIRAARSNADASVLYNVTFLTYEPQGGPRQRIEADTAALVDGAWLLESAKAWQLDTVGVPEAQAETFSTLLLPSTLTLDRIRESLGAVSGLSIWDVPRFIAQLEQAGFSAQRHKVWFQSELSLPLFFVGLVLIGAAFTMRHTRLGGTGKAVLSALMLGFVFFFARSFAIILGENGQLHVALSAWTVPAATLLFALGLLLHAEDG